MSFVRMTLIFLLGHKINLSKFQTTGSIRLSFFTTRLLIEKFATKNTYYIVTSKEN